MVYTVQRVWGYNPKAGCWDVLTYLRIFSPAKVVPAEVFPDGVVAGAGAGAGRRGQAPHLVKLSGFV